MLPSEILGTSLDGDICCGNSDQYLNMIKKGKDYRRSRPDVVSYVDHHFPHAVVDSKGNWYADTAPFFAPRRKFASIEIAFVFNTDLNYYPGLVVALRSLLEHHPDTPVVIIERDLSDIQKRYLMQFAEVVPSRRFIPDHVAWDRFEATFLKYHRVVFLDCDIVVLRPLDAFIHTQAHFAAVKNLDWKVRENFRSEKTLKKYKISPDKPAFFAGGFSLDNQVWGNGKLFEQAAELYGQDWEDFLYGDQSALQILMYRNHGEITLIPDEYNALAECWDWGQSRHLARVVHYTGEWKPWHPQSCQAEEDYFFHYSKIVKT